MTEIQVNVSTGTKGLSELAYRKQGQSNFPTVYFELGMSLETGVEVPRPPVLPSELNNPVVFSNQMS